MHGLGYGLPGSLIQFAPHTLVQINVSPGQEFAFASGVPASIHRFYLSTDHSNSLSRTRV